MASNRPLVINSSSYFIRNSSRTNKTVQLDTDYLSKLQIYCVVCLYKVPSASSSQAIRTTFLHFARLTSPLTALTKKNQPFQWTATEESVFQAIKKACSTALVLQHFDLDKECTVKTNASDYVFATVFSQPDHENILRPVAFMSCRPQRLGGTPALICAYVATQL